LLKWQTPTKTSRTCCHPRVRSLPLGWPEPDLKVLLEPRHNLVVVEVVLTLQATVMDLVAHPGLDTTAALEVLEAPGDLEGLNPTVGTDLAIVEALEEDQEDQGVPDQDQASILHPLTATSHLEGLPDHRTVIPRDQVTLQPRDLLVVSLALSTRLRPDLNLQQVLHRLSSPGLPRLAPTPPPPHLQLKARPPTASLRQTSRHQLPLPSRGQLPPLTPGLLMLRLLTTRRLTRLTPGPRVPPHLTTILLLSPDIRDILQHPQVIQDIPQAQATLEAPPHPTTTLLALATITPLLLPSRATPRMDTKEAPQQAIPTGLQLVRPEVT
jgi:hypothetical protein